ncbi:hypothetical protein [Psychroflexus planctonicus]|uniref:Uncharacterized protein n=1 Tax=Psychroflexus planctonicus TaxID=1526575 RepID=A0ABQ1SHS5_9FLAO|nr:hypothetical protein [Psychroflexus planctonicus]GGE32442.1 hypothetical protein GCM10010832_10900 [Psychroflexus planctonicus]
MNFFDKLFYTNKYIKSIHLKFFLLFFKTKKLDSNFDLSEEIKKSKSLVVLASGPSAKKYRHEKDDLIITTNSSYLMLHKHARFIHIIKDLGYLHKFLMFGLKFKPLAVIIDINTHSNGKGFGAHSIKLLKSYLGRRYYSFPVIITDNENLFTENRVNYGNQMSDFFEINKIKRSASNSGELIYAYGVWLSSQENRTMKVFGIDAGEGGNKHFDGRSTASNHVAFRDHNKKRMSDFFGECQNKYSHIFNYSFFKNNTETTNQ